MLNELLDRITHKGRQVIPPKENLFSFVLVDHDRPPTDLHAAKVSIERATRIFLDTTDLNGLGTIVCQKLANVSKQHATNALSLSRGQHIQPADTPFESSGVGSWSGQNISSDLTSVGGDEHSVSTRIGGSGD